MKENPMDIDLSPHANIDAVISYAQTWSEHFSQSLQGESEATIAAYEHHIGCCLPAFYRGYLERMGRSDHGLFSSAEIRTNLALLQEFLEKEITTGEDQIAPGCILIGLGAAAVEQVWMDAAPPHAVFEGSLGEKINLWADSFVKLLFRDVFLQYHFKRFAHSQTYATWSNPGLVRRATSGIAALAAEALWFSDQVCLCAEGPGYSLVVYQLQPTQGAAGVWVRISSHRLREIERIALWINQHLHVTLHRTA